MNTTCLLDYSLLAAEKPHELNLLVKLKAPEASESDRKPLNVGLVLDRSGSMAGDKLEKTKEAAGLVIRNLAPKDRLSVVTFDDKVQTLIPPGPVENQQSLLAQIDSIQAGGMTNLSGGWLKGVQYVASDTQKEAIRRILLMTDGQTNQGITDPDQLVGIGHSVKQEHGIVTTTLGFGEGFDEDLLTGIAQQAGGNHYYIESADDAPEIFTEELGELLRLVAQNIEVKVSMAEPVQFLAQWTDYPVSVSGPEVTFHLDDAHATEQKALMLSLYVPGLQKLGPTSVATVEVRFSDIGTETVTDQVIRQEVMVNIADAEAADQAEPEIEVLHQLGLQIASKARKDAIHEADQGDFDAARRVMEDAAGKLEKMPGEVAAKLREEIKALLDQRDRTTPAHYSEGTRKQMRSDSYNMSSGKMDMLRRARERRKRDSDPDQPE